jgi:nucleoside-diphosphate-sugar epimerase
MQNIFLTGATGCCGSYLAEQLLQQNIRLYLGVRHPERLPKWLRDDSRVEILIGDLHDLTPWHKALEKSDILIHPAVHWGGPETFRINVRQTHALLDAVDPERCQQVMLFSTASILNPAQQLEMRALKHGTEYIRSKAVAHVQLGTHKLAERITWIYPTVVLGGDAHHPYSAASQQPTQLLRWLHLLRWMTAQGAFHFIHAHDLATVVCQLLVTARPGGHWVVGQPALQVSEALYELCRYTGLRYRPYCDLDRLWPAIRPLVVNRMTSWDHFVFQHHRYVTYPAVRPEDFAATSVFPDLASVFSALQKSDNPPK